jgi:hypothetical protein
MSIKFCGFICMEAKMGMPRNPISRHGYKAVVLAEIGSFEGNRGVNVDYSELGSQPGLSTGYFGGEPSFEYPPDNFEANIRLTRIENIQARRTPVIEKGTYRMDNKTGARAYPENFKLL